ncbi:MAG: S8 family peptidase, partial [bacterium]
MIKLKNSPQTNATVPNMPAAAGTVGLAKLHHQLGAKRITPLFQKRPVNYFHAKRSNFDRYVKVTFSPERNLKEILAAYQKNDLIEFVQPNYLHKVDFAPNDSLFTQQAALLPLQAEAAWELQLASSEIIVGVIDTGIDYLHQDLRDALWLNSGEDLNGNGRVDSSDFNGIDDDANGFVDDLRGWDFTDAPTFPDGGDFQTPDNDPFDENGHGTSVAGIIGATGNNHRGIAGLAFGCKIMNLRSGTSLGFLEEDDVASAIVYAVENGARIINMSFGDEAASPLLRDVMRFAFENDCVLVASAGNSNSDKIHFPSGFAETISVGATNDEDRLAGFSNFGASVDVVAPGVNVLTTQRENKYGSFSGTSASAPFVSALAALILSKSPLLSNESVQGLIVSTADDLGETGWDHFFAAGRINALQALQTPYYSMAAITRPSVDEGFTGDAVPIRGTAAGTFLDEYLLQLGVGETPQEWQDLMRQKNRQVIEEDLWELDISSLVDTLYTLRLQVKNKNGIAVEDKVRFFIDRTPPAIANVRQTAMLDGSQHSFLLEFETDDLCDAAIFFRPANSDENFQQKKLRFRTTQHRLHFTQDIFMGQMEFYLEAVNGAGLSSRADNRGSFYTVDLSLPAIGGPAVDLTGSILPPAFLLSKTADFDRDGHKEIILNQYDAEFNFGFLKIFEFQENQFQEVFSTGDILIPRDWSDADGDGLLEILAGAGGKSVILESPSAGAFPANIVWADSGDVWASRFADLDQDGAGEIILRKGNLYSLWETTVDNTYALVDS